MSPRTTIQPKETKNLDIYGNPPLEWSRVMQALDTVGEWDYASPGSRFWFGISSMV